MPLLNMNANNQNLQLYEENHKNEQSIECALNDCLNGGLCYKSLSNKGQMTHKCKCPMGFSGVKCELLHTVKFEYEDSYLELETPDLESKFNFTFTLITEAEYGVLLYHGSRSKQHLAIELFKGRIRISFDVGNTPASTLFSYANLYDSNICI